MYLEIVCGSLCLTVILFQFDCHELSVLVSSQVRVLLSISVVSNLAVFYVCLEREEKKKQTNIKTM